MMLIVIMLIVKFFIIIMVNDIMQSVVMLSVVAPTYQTRVKVGFNDTRTRSSTKLIMA